MISTSTINIHLEIKISVKLKIRFSARKGEVCHSYKLDHSPSHIGKWMGPAVELVQEIIKAAPVDGSFGLITQYCVKQYQQSKGIQADGIVAPRTWEMLIST